ncbi:C2 domain-containing protein [Catenaria anguillulae PL171]|uniref:C2 domain-containing protein n=1 Tax=Catenaria anguillulae PL171 TaxID=765915 RepID=A0A1Y2HMQ7_9FUNG|nr:C2 domain-containing protein [Catenaria anguillulae PL171]
MTTQVPVAILTVTAIQARGLPKMDLMGDTDAFLKLSVDLSCKEAEALAHSQSKLAADEAAKAVPALFAKTQVADHALPVWHETFPFPIVDKAPKVLYVEAWDEDSGSKDDLIGTGMVDVPRILIEADAAAGAQTASGGSQEAKLAERQRVAIVWVPLVNPDGKNVGEVQIMIHYLPKSAIQRMSEKFSKSTDQFKNALTAKVVHYATDMATGSIKGYFKK